MKDYISILSPSTGDFTLTHTESSIPTSFTLSFYIQALSLTSLDARYIMSLSIFSSLSFHIDKVSNKYTLLNTLNPSNLYIIGGNIRMDLNTWVHISIVREQNVGLTLYLNSVLCGVMLDVPSPLGDDQLQINVFQGATISIRELVLFRNPLPLQHIISYKQMYFHTIIYTIGKYEVD